MSLFEVHGPFLSWSYSISGILNRFVSYPIVLVLATASSAPSQDQTSRDQVNSVQAQVDFKRDVQPILEARCTVCHGSQTQMSDFRLDRRRDALKGGLSGKPAIVPGKSDESPLVRYVSGLDPKIVMPPNGERLTSEQIGLLRAWIDQGAIWPEISQGDAAGSQTSTVHWSFQPVQSPRVPGVKGSAWVRTPIDNFVLAKLEEKGWTPSPPAEPRSLLRRVYLDLTGLPPAPAEQESFVSHPTMEALDKIIDNLLSRSSYGERWGRHWLDLVRYAETNGYERDAVKPHVWRYRDYVIRAFNNDKPYDRFILEQLAGDELPEVNAETLVATGYNRLGPWDDEPADRQQDRFDQLDDIVSTTSQVFLGLTLGCARCHNHKFDPLTMEDYYGMVAIFSGLERPKDGRIELDLPIGTPQEIEKERERNRPIEAFRKQIEELQASFRYEFLKAGRSKLPNEAVEALLVEPGKRTEVQMVYAQAYAQAFDQEIAPALPEDLKLKTAAFEQRIEEIRKAKPDLPRGYFMDETGPTPPPTHVLKRGQAAQPGPEVSPRVPAVLVEQQPAFPAGKRTSLRRLTLARWLASADNPLTARVIVNRVWQFHFGEGLVRTPSDFGRMGEKPSHPELLDWLANWFVKQGWSIKKLHRLIMTSNTYRMNSRANSECAGKDPEDRLLWRMPVRRLDVETIRDSMLSVSGQLNRKAYGPSIYPQMPETVLQAHHDREKAWKPYEEEEASRRTIYVHIKRSMIVPLLEVLDFCDTSRSSANRLVTNIAPQALTLFNGADVNRQARYFARRLVNEVGTDSGKQVERAYLLALCRRPTPTEQVALQQFLQSETENALREAAESRETSSLENAHLEALEQMCRAIFNLNEFVYVD
jgi:hypothetical protein